MAAPTVTDCQKRDNVTQSLKGKGLIMYHNIRVFNLITSISRLPVDVLALLVLFAPHSHSSGSQSFVTSQRATIPAPRLRPGVAPATRVLSSNKHRECPSQEHQEHQEPAFQLNL